MPEVRIETSWLDQMQAKELKPLGRRDAAGRPVADLIPSMRYLRRS